MLRSPALCKVLFSFLVASSHSELVKSESQGLHSFSRKRGNVTECLIVYLKNIRFFFRGLIIERTVRIHCLPSSKRPGRIILSMTFWYGGVNATLKCFFFGFSIEGSQQTNKSKENCIFFLTEDECTVGI